MRDSPYRLRARSIRGCARCWRSSSTAHCRTGYTAATTQTAACRSRRQSDNPRWARSTIARPAVTGTPLLSASPLKPGVGSRVLAEHCLASALRWAWAVAVGAVSPVARPGACLPPAERSVWRVASEETAPARTTAGRDGHVVSMRAWSTALHYADYESQSISVCWRRVWMACSCLSGG
jgi:hypothetical protein